MALLVVAALMAAMTTTFAAAQRNSKERQPRPTADAAELEEYWGTEGLDVAPILCTLLVLVFVILGIIKTGLTK
jgi:hypothetical protein